MERGVQLGEDSELSKITAMVHGKESPRKQQTAEKGLPVTIKT
jgi:hypothetical protein